MPRPDKSIDRLSDTDGRRSPLYIQSVEKALSVLAVFDGQFHVLSLSQISQRSGLNLSATQRFVHTLRTLGMLEKDEEKRGFYRLTPKLLQFSFAYMRSSEVVNRCVPYLLELSNKWSETTNLTVLDGTEIVIVFRFLSRHLVNVDTIVGSRLPAFCTAPGLAILATFENDEIASILERSDRKKLTQHTITDPAKIMKRISQIRDQGFAVVAEEIVLGDVSVSAPVIGSSGRAVGAINIAVPTNRWSVDQARESFAKHIMAAAHQASVRANWAVRSPPKR